MTELVRLAFAESDSPPPPCAVGAFGVVVPKLLDRLLEETDDALAGLVGVGDGAALIVLGDEGALPWVDGVVYFARCADAPAVLLPTTLVANAPGVLVEGLLDPHSAVLPALVVPSASAIELYSVRSARPLRRSKLEALRGTLG